MSKLICTNTETCIGIDFCKGYCANGERCEYASNEDDTPHIEELKAVWKLTTGEEIKVGSKDAKKI